LRIIEHTSDIDGSRGEPEMVFLVLETVGRIDDFHRAVSGIEVSNGLVSGTRMRFPQKLRVLRRRCPDQALPRRIYLLLFDDVVSTSFNPFEHLQAKP